MSCDTQYLGHHIEAKPNERRVDDEGGPEMNGESVM